MTVAAGQPYWLPQGSGVDDFIVTFETEKTLAYEMRYKSVVGRLSQLVKTKMVKSGQEENEIDIGVSAGVWRKEITKGDTVRFTMEQALSGEPTFGDVAVGPGDYLAYLHADVQLNSLTTPYFKLQGEMSRMLVADTLTDPEGQTRTAITLYLAEQYVLDFYEGALRGASRNLLAPVVQGGKNKDLGRGAGKQVSPENFLVVGNGFTAGVSGTDAYEAQILTDLGTLTNTSTDMISREFIHNLRAAVTQQKIKPITDENGRDKWYVICDPELMTQLTDPTGALYAAWLAARERSDKNPVFGHGSLELDDFVFFPDMWLSKFRPDISGAEVVWGQDGIDKRNFNSTSKLGLMLIIGEGAMLEASNGTVNITVEHEKHKPKNMTLAGSVKESFMRRRYVPKDGRTGLVINQSMMTVVAYAPGLSYSG